MYLIEKKQYLENLISLKNDILENNEKILIDLNIRAKHLTNLKFDHYNTEDYLKLFDIDQLEHDIIENNYGIDELSDIIFKLNIEIFELNLINENFEQSHEVLMFQYA